MKKQDFMSEWSVETAQLSEMMPSADRKMVTLPHDMLIDQRRIRGENDEAGPAGGWKSHVMRGCWPTGAYKYSRAFFVPQEWKEKSVYIEFEGVYRDGQILINDDYAMHHANGYTSFVVNLDKYLRYGRTNTISVLARNGDDSRWYTGVGIYRPVHMMIGGLLHVKPNGLKISTESVDEYGAEIVVSTDLCNKSHLRRKVFIETSIYSADGTKIAEGRNPITVFAADNAVLRQRLFVSRPLLWDAENPHLYTCEINVYEKEQLIDTTAEHFGIRKMSLSAEHGLTINGKKVKLRGGAVHADNGPVGAATFAASEYRRVRILKEAGFNAIRMAHHPASRALMDACDEIGMYLMDEYSDMWGRGKTNDDYATEFEASWTKDVTAMVDMAYNHPCVIMYSIGNELPDAGSPVSSSWGRIIAKKIKALDPYRYTINCINGLVGLAAIQDDTPDSPPAASQQGGDVNQTMNDLVLQMEMIMQLPVVGEATEESFSYVDIAGYNYMEPRYELDTKLFPNRIICGSETYPPAIDTLWSKVKAHENIIGDFTWTAWDYLGENGVGKVIYSPSPAIYMDYPWQSAGTGDIDIIGNRRTISYYREIVFGLRKDPYIAVWRPEHYRETPITTPWSWSDTVSGWTWEGFEGKPTAVEVYADADEVALLCNDVEIGRQPCGAEQRYIARFDTIYTPGTLCAIAYKNGEETGKYALRTAVGDTRIHISAEKEALSLENGNLFYFMIELTDSEGRVFHNREEQITISATGAGKLIASGSARPSTEEHFFENTHRTFDGKLLAVVRPTEKGNLVLEAKTENGNSETISVLVA